VISFALEIWNDETDRVTFYSVRTEDAEHSEMDNFILRMQQDPQMTEPLQKLLQLITEVIGNTYGAIDTFFNRIENRVFALPPKGNIKISEIEFHYPGFPLRLYCLALSEDIVILFNGGIKDAQEVQQASGSISVKFYEANEFAKRIQSALNDGIISLAGRQIVNFRGGTEIYL
jgi:hypothetical protein